nr:G-type lectin S-receptor-like serine/threonine-protein kinase At4g27290 [Ipomoea batatas]
MRLKVNKKTGKRNLIRSWIGRDDPRPGKFSWGMDPKGSPQFLIWKEDKPYYRSNLYHCLAGFKPKSQKDWDKGNYGGGCVRRKDLQCDGNDRFMRLPRMKWPDHSTSLGNMTFEECEIACSRNCSCSAFAYANISTDSSVNCLNWFGDLVDLTHNYSAGLNGFGQDLYVRVHASELDGSGGNEHSAHKNKGLVAIIVASVSAFFLVAVVAYILNRKYFRRKEGYSVTISFQGFLSEFGMVAIKRLSKRSSQGLEEFMNELKLIAKLQHTNLVSLISAMISLLCYDVLADGSGGNEHSAHKNKGLVAIILGDDGDLQLLDGRKNIIWSTNISGSELVGNPVEAYLQNNGNLILKQGDSPIWESFDDTGGDTLMPGMKLKVNTKHYQILD